ncbi:hypothetical protein FHX78_114429 [Streptomyces capillispiralis]|uniref:Uncharacterized protein n=1 Tax=Streptomyces capillispiralis TaxID=68182 RepID=A0A561TK40_9ACTN|nr:hypothetical protein FHX78_114429 [Streptomyces capillispiralis]
MRATGVGLRPVAAVAVSASVLVGLPALYFLTGYGCGADEDRLAEVMAAETVLDGAPEGARREDRYQECDDDDRFVVVAAQYRYDGSSGAALRHYGEAARADGWRPRDGAGSGTAPSCFAKSLGGTTAYLHVEGPEHGLLHVSLVADAAKSQWC